MTDARPTDPIDFIEFHDGTIDRVERGSDTDVTIVFDHLYVCIRNGSDHAGWSYRAQLVLTGVSRFEQDGELDELSTLSKRDKRNIIDGDVCDANGVSLDLRQLLDGAPAASFKLDYLSPEYVAFSADITHAKLILLEAVERIEDCYIDRPD